MHENRNKHNTGTKTIKMIRKSLTSCYWGDDEKRKLLYGDFVELLYGDFVELLYGDFVEIS